MLKNNTKNIDINIRKRQNEGNFENENERSFEDENLTPSHKSTSTEKLGKLDILALNNGWNSNNEKFIVSIGENAASYKYMHEKVAARYVIYDRIIKIIITILTVIITAEYYITIFQTNQILTVIQAVITTILAVMSLIYNFLNYVELSKDHANTASLFGVLYHDIRNIMCLYRKDRPDAVRYIQRGIKEYDHLEVNGPNIPDWQLSDFQKKFEKANISMPDVTARIQKIEIIQEPSNNLNVKNKESNKSTFKLNNTNNLTQIQECFKIDGDLSENDNLTYSDIVKRKEHLNKQSDYEMNRFMSHIVKNNPEDLV